LVATNYHSHLGTSYGGLVIFDGKKLQKKIHTIEKAQFKTRFLEDIDYALMEGHSGIGVISDRDTQPLILRLKFGEYSICGTGFINNQIELANELTSEGAIFSETVNGCPNQIELVANLINKGKDLIDGIEYMQSRIDGSMSLLLLGKEGLYAARDKYGRTPHNRRFDRKRNPIKKLSSCETLECRSKRNTCETRLSCSYVSMQISFFHEKNR